MKTAEIRSKFLNFFETNEHTIVASSSLVPHNDPTLLFTNAGMNQFKDVFLGKDLRPYKRATSSQKCVRAGGKHNDLENVGFTARHHTFFEMLGNFSFGDYFKKEAIALAWKFVTQELGMPKDLLYVTVFETDDEAADIWHTQEGVPKDRIYRFGEKDNFWSMGDTGPCGPCSEIFIDRGEKYSCKKPTCKMGCDCDRYMEFWNLVFMQYNREPSGKLNPLPKPSVDTGAGLERIASILQGTDTNYDTDGFSDIIQKTSQLARLPYDPKNELAVSFRVVADHARAATFLISDGVMPSNEGRGYVLRRIMRRAIRHGKKLGFTTPFLFKTSAFVIDQMKEAYPDLSDKRIFIERAIQAEEDLFFKTLERGLGLLDEETSKLGAIKILEGSIAFKLYDTYGFPLDLTRVILEERGLSVDELGFTTSMEFQRAESRKHWKGSGDQALDALYFQISQNLAQQSKLPIFTGYNSDSELSECVALLIHDGKELKLVDSFTANTPFGGVDEQSTFVEAIFLKTPFYGESGGQTGDRGRVTSTDFEGLVTDVQKPIPELTVVHLKPIRGTLKVGSLFKQETDKEVRALTARNHTATHMLHWALRSVLGTHVKQAGSLVTADLLRFDFSHFQALNRDELKKIEDMVNEKIWDGSRVQKREMDKDQAIAAGAIAFFGDKYGDKVRVISVGDFSTELCGGTHVDHSSEVNLFKIISEAGIAAGVRRMIAYTSKGAFEYLRNREKDLTQVRDGLKLTNFDEIPIRLDKIQCDIKDYKKQIETFVARGASAKVDELLEKPLMKGNVAWLITEVGLMGPKELRDLADKIKQKSPNSVAVLAMREGAKATLLVAVGPEAQKAWSAQKIIQQLAPFIDGRGGGKADMAQAGGTKTEGLKPALEKAKTL